MMEALKDWILAVTAVAILTSAALSLCPQGAVKKIVRLICGLLMLLVVLRPAAGLLGGNGLPELEAYRADVQSDLEERERASQEVLEDIIAEQTAAYIVDKAAELGAQCRVQVWCRTGEDGLLLPDRAEISGSLTAGQREELAGLIESELDIPAQRQDYREGSEG